MKVTGFVRKVSPVGRITIPRRLRSILNISENDELEILIKGDWIILKKYEPSCVFCGDTAALSYRGKNICNSCEILLLEND